MAVGVVEASIYNAIAILKKGEKLCWWLM